MDVGARVDKYEILEPLGEGGFAQVYRVRHIHLESVHALKVLRPEFVEREDLRQRFLDEGRLQAQLQHPGIARVTDIVAEPGAAGLVMEFLQGLSLADLIEQRAGPIPETEIVELMLPVLDALHFAHESDVIHRDIKPDNIFLVEIGNGKYQPKILDFGIARVRGELRAKGRRKSTVATRMGTEGYASPEQLRSAADVDRRADLFSIGVTIYEMATGALPFERESDVDSLMALMNGEYEIPEKLKKKSPRLAHVIEQTVKIDREQRLGNCLQVVEALTKGAPAEKEKQPGGGEDVDWFALRLKTNTLLLEGRNIEAVTAVTMETGWGVKRAKAWIETNFDEPAAPKGRSSSSSQSGHKSKKAPLKCKSCQRFLPKWAHKIKDKSKLICDSCANKKKHEEAAKKRAKQKRKETIFCGECGKECGDPSTGESLNWPSGIVCLDCAQNEAGYSPVAQASTPANTSEGGFNSEEARQTRAVIGGIIGFLIGLPAGGIGAVPGAFIGAMIGAALGELMLLVGCLILVAIIAVIVVASQL